jgi:hypothetical protein
VDNSCGLRFMRVRAPAPARVQARVWRGCGCGCGVGAGAAWVRMRRGCGRGCGVDTARRWSKVGVSGVRPGDRGLEIKVRARRLRSWELIRGWGSEITRGLRPGGCGSCVGLAVLFRSFVG